MSNDFNHQPRSVSWIRPTPDFTEDTAFVGVQLPPQTGNIAGEAIVVPGHSLE
jgi:hypothetical protein